MSVQPRGGEGEPARAGSERPTSPHRPGSQAQAGGRTRCKDTFCSFLSNKDFLHKSSAVKKVAGTWGAAQGQCACLVHMSPRCHPCTAKHASGKQRCGRQRARQLHRGPPGGSGHPASPQLSWKRGRAGGRAGRKSGSRQPTVGRVAQRHTRSTHDSRRAGLQGHLTHGPSRTL